MKKLNRLSSRMYSHLFPVFRVLRCFVVSSKLHLLFPSFHEALSLYHSVAYYEPLTFFVVSRVTITCFCSLCLFCLIIVFFSCFIYCFAVSMVVFFHVPHNQFLHLFFCFVVIRFSLFCSVFQLEAH